MKHAYLILAHNNFEVLSRLVAELDDIRNDIFIHVDARVSGFPRVKTKDSGVFYLERRLKTYWGHISLLKAELELLRTALDSGEYDYLHIISGTHFPLKSQDSIDAYFSDSEYESVVQPAVVGENEAMMKFGAYHLFVRGLYNGRKTSDLYNVLWRICLRLQCGWLHRNMDFLTEKASQWCSLTRDDAAELLRQEKNVVRRFRNTFCCDEYFITYFFNRYGIKYRKENRLLYVDFMKANPKFLTDDDYGRMMESGCLFARKIADSDIGLIDRICQSTHI